MCAPADIAALKAALPKLPDSKLDFASSLIQQAEKGKKPLSGKQIEWVGKLVDLAINGAPKPSAIAIGASLAGVTALIEKAVANGLKRPSIRLALPTGNKLGISRAAPTGKNAGFLYLKVDGEYRGKIDPKGELFPFQLPDADKGVVVVALAELAANPQGVALAYGKLTNSCCFCGKDLTDDRSVVAGYGPQCAEHYGLPWGHDA